MRILVDGFGVLGGFGHGQVAMIEALNRGMVEPTVVDVPFSRGKHPRSALLADTTGLEGFLSKRALRRADHFSRLALLGACLALEDAGQLQAPKDRLGVIIATGYGPTRTTFAFLDSVIIDGDVLASPTHFSSSVHNVAAAYLSKLLNITGPCLTVSQFEMSFGSALLTARQWLLENRVDAVLLGAVDEYCDVLGYCWGKLFNGCPGGEMNPLDFSSQTAIPGEGAAFFVLSDKAGGQDVESSLCIRDVSLGNIQDPGFALPADALLCIGAAGHLQCAQGYARALSKDHVATAYAPLYGSLPTGQGLDMAVACLTLRNSACFKQPGSLPEKAGFQTIGPGGERFVDMVRCFTIGPGGEYALITLGQPG